MQKGNIILKMYRSPRIVVLIIDTYNIILRIIILLLLLLYELFYTSSRMLKCTHLFLLNKIFNQIMLILIKFISFHKIIILVVFLLHCHDMLLKG